MTTDLLSVWTDPDTAMHAVGASLGIFADGLPGSGTLPPPGASLQNALLDVLLTLVDEGELEKRACADGRYAFRWREAVESTAVCTDATSARLDACLGSMPRALPWSANLAATATVVDAGVAPGRQPPGPRFLAMTAPLVLPTVSCMLALVVFVVLGNVVGLIVLGALALAGIVGLVRRVPLAGFWTMGVVVAALVMRVS
ncbi:MAG TPA: hypothetical protein VL856_06325 [Acidimicrobiia bacterium]|nr:hypothetical protein [Acidimicrobiia bacterium]